MTIARPHERRFSLRVTRDEAVARRAAPASIKLIAEIPGNALLLVDTYPSIPGGMSYCQAGEESFLRLISFSPGHPRETYRLKVESCRDNIELASPGLVWSTADKTLVIHWLSAPGEIGKPEERILKIGIDGRPL